MKSAGCKGLWPSLDAPGRRAAVAASAGAGLVPLASRPGSGRGRDLRRCALQDRARARRQGDTHKDKTLQTEFTEREDGSDRRDPHPHRQVVPVIRAWDMTPGSPTRGEVLTIR